ncbi:hypothetical protein AEA09_01620 [Lysinibacillus contaminans]|uniref:SLH domain-containing protein n=1 Tax=Lysinibacillus contaminans TaxID=1293441 RepID=A0ABR5K5Y9_9BACI|nr:S-layer homology domain-containing protein [Lysinibacillus contaminans]KOS71709.1 hypothetical protein AEA09_01620 [Lysinibacillus contaminans]
MRKTILAGAISITCLSGGFGLQVQAQGNVDVPSIASEKTLFATTNSSQVQTMSYQDIYKIFLLSKFGLSDDQMTLTANKNENSMTIKISLEAILQSYEKGENLYTEGESEFKVGYEEYKKIFGNAIQMKITQSGTSFKAEIFAEGKWQAVSGQELDVFLMVANRADIDLKPGGYFTDTIGHWAESYIQLLYQAGIVSGTTDTLFNPNGQVTRGQLVAMIFRASGLDVNEDYEGPATYKDIQGFWGAKEVAILQEYGLIDIFDGQNFEPNKPVTREEMAYVTANYLGAMEYDIEKANKNNTFADKNQMRKETVEAIGLLQQLEIIDGGSGKFNPKGNLTRAQFSKIMALTLMIATEE